MKELASLWLKSWIHTMECNIEKMALEHTGLVKSVALRLSYVYGEEVDDLIQIGYIGLIKAIKGFDPQKGFKFSTYAVPLITGEIKSQLRDQGRIKVSRSTKADIIFVKKIEEQFLLKKGRTPKLSELAIETNLPRERIIQALQARDAMTNMEDFEQIDLMVSEEELNVTRLDLAKCLNDLDKIERQVMILRYYKDLTQSQVADIMKISQVKVCRIEKKSLKFMAEFMSK